MDCVVLQEFDYTVMVEESTRAALAGILTHQFKEKKEKKEMKSSPPPSRGVHYMYSPTIACDQGLYLKSLICELLHELNVSFSL